MEKLRLYANSVPITFNSWIVSFVGIVLIRAFLEQFSSFKPGEFIFINLSNIIHFNAFFIATIVGLIVVLMFFAKTSIREVSVVCLFGIMIIWVPPIVDLILGGVGGNAMSYVFLTGKELLFYFIAFFGGFLPPGVTHGMQTGIIMEIIFCYIYVYAVTKNIFRALGAAIVFYIFLSFLGSILSLIALFLPLESGVSTSIVQSIVSSHIIQNNLDPNFVATNQGLVEFAFNKTMIGFNTLVAILATFSLFFLGARKKLMAIIKNSRPERMFYYFLLFTFGVVLAREPWFSNWIDIQSYLLAVVSFVCVGMFSICQNDIHDEAIDVISNKNRPLITKELSKDDLETASKIFLIFALLSAYASSLYVLFFTCLGLFIFFIYSNPPLRLKRFVMLSSGLISLACVSVVLEGFFLINSNKIITAFPFSLILAIIVFHLAFTNFRDLKDFEGDQAAGIKTIPVLLGLKKSKKLIAGFVCSFFLIIPWYFHISFLVAPSIVASLLYWYFINEENYKEWKAFSIFMIYLILIITTIAFK